MSKRTISTYSLEFCLEVAQEVTSKGRSIKDASMSRGLVKSTVEKWAEQLMQEQNGQLSNVTPQHLKLMKQAGLLSCQYPIHRYSKSEKVHLNIPNVFNRQFQPSK